MGKYYNVNEKNEVTIESLKFKDYYAMEFNDAIQNSDIILLPFENYREKYEILYPENTREFFMYIKDKKINVEIPCSDEQYREIQLHCSNIELASMIFNVALLPIVINLISSFIYDILKNKGKEDKEKTNVKFKLYSEDKKNKKTVEIEYDGPASEISKVMEEVDKIVNK